MTQFSQHKGSHLLSYFLLTLVGFTMVLPFYWLVLTSLKSPAQGALDPTSWWPETPWQLARNDVRNWPAFSRKLVAAERSGITNAAGRVWELVEEKPREIFRATSLKDATPVPRGQRPNARQLIIESDKGIMRSALNAVLQRPDFHVETHFPNLTLPPEAVRAREMSPFHFNRMVLDASFPEDIVPAHRYHWENYATVILETRFARALFNSVFVTLTVTFGLVLTSSLAAFAFARLTFTGRDKIFLGYLATLMIPSAVTMIPVFMLVRELGWADTYAGLILPVMFSAYGTFMLRQFFMSVPTDLEEAALLDGCSLWGVYRHVIMPLSTPALAALAILTFMSVWRSFMWPLVVTHTRDMYVLPVALAAFREMYGVQWHLMMAGSVIMIVPMLIVFIFGQRYFIEGIKLGGVKG